MGSVSGLFNIAKLSLQAQQSAMQVTGQNVANVNTPGYSRQEAVFSETEPIDGGPGQVGTGVQVSEIRRKFDRFIEAQITQGKEDFGSLEARKEALSRIEMLFNDSQGLGLHQALDEFFQSFQDLANNPSGAAERTMVLQRAETLVSVFNRTGNELSRIQQDMNTQISQNVTEINSLTSQIADLNEKIAQAEVSGQNANDFRDMRGKLLNDLAGHIDIQYFEDSSGQLSIFAAGTANLVEGHTARNLSVSENAGNNGFYDVLFDQGNGNTVDITSRIGGGALGGLILTRDTTLPGIGGQVDLLADTIVTEVNNQHELGYGLDGSTGNDLFSALAGTQDAATNMAVALSDTNKVAAAATVNGLPGDNTNALALVQLQNQLTMNGGKVTFNGYYRDVVQGIGSTLQQVNRSYDAQDFSLQQMDKMREATSGVSLDEEMANLIRFQRAFEASAKLIGVADDMLKTVIDMI